MRRIRTGLYPVGRLQAGAAILMAAAAANVVLVQRRLGLFAREHRAYQKVHGVVEETAAQLRTRLAIVTAFDARQDAALDDLAWALAGDRHPRRNPFASFGIAAPWVVKRLNYGEKAKTIHRLAAAVQEYPMVSPATRRTAEAADKVARLMEKALLSVEKLQASLHTARVARAAAAKAWDTAQAVLKLDVRAAAREGAPGLDTALFGRNRPKRKAATTAETPAETTALAAASATTVAVATPAATAGS